MMGLLNDWKGFVRFHFLHAVFESKIIDALETPIDIESLAARLSIERMDLLEAILNLGVSLNEIALKKGKYSLKGKRIKMLRGEKGDKFAAWIQAHVYYYNSAYSHFNDRLHGAPDGNYLELHGDLIARASKMLDPFIDLFIARHMIKNKKTRILEAGCGSGIYLKKAYEVNEELYGIALDYDTAVTKQAKDNIKAWGLQDSFDVIQGDIFELGQEHMNSFDLVTMYNMIYYFPVEKRLELLKKVKTYLDHNGTLILVSSEQGKKPSAGTANLDVINRSIKGCYEIPKNGEIEMLLKNAGFKLLKKESLFPGENIYGYIATINH